MAQVTNERTFTIQLSQKEADYLLDLLVAVHFNNTERSHFYSDLYGQLSNQNGGVPVGRAFEETYELTPLWVRKKYE